MTLQAALKEDHTVRDLQRPAPCPACASRTVAVIHATRSSLYLACRICEHTWHTGLGPVDPLRRRTSAAFRMTTRIVAAAGTLVSVN